METASGVCCISYPSFLLFTATVVFFVAFFGYHPGNPFSCLPFTPVYVCFVLGCIFTLSHSVYYSFNFSQTIYLHLSSSSGPPFLRRTRNCFRHMDLDVDGIGMGWNRILAGVGRRTVDILVCSIDLLSFITHGRILGYLVGKGMSCPRMESIEQLYSLSTPISALPCCPPVKDTYLVSRPGCGDMYVSCWERKLTRHAT
ncbi:hypothetical protein B0J18DRAFT_194525 [Chaetomium sp. MPI-SDFR-AT-0129]|nr:hypothetical protein B0J18DRAFT_194525 [Chaetomium sp. MPI-SDFR-AT-0129]